MTLANVEIGKKYKNIDTNIECIVRNRIFFNIQYYEFKKDSIEYILVYTHYKRFRKHWVEI